MIPHEILEAILIFSMSATFIMLAMLFYPYAKKWIYPNTNKNKSKNRSIKPKAYPIKNKSNIKDKVITKNKSKNLNSPNLDSINITQKDTNDFSLTPNRQNIDKSLNEDSVEGEYNDLDDKGENVDVSLKWINKDKDLNKLNVNNGNYDFVAKSWNEPMLENQKEIVDNFRGTVEDLNELKHESPSSNESKQKISFLIDDEPKNNEHANKELSNDENNLKDDNLNNKGSKTSKTKSIHDEQVKLSDDLSHLYNSNLEKISVGKHVIFNYNDESYLSEILEIKHNNIKILYRGSYKWIQVSNIKKIL